MSRANDFKIIAGLAVLALFCPARAAYAQSIEYYHTDALGTPVAVTDSDRNVLQRSEYDPFGKLLNHSLTDGPAYTGHMTDAATGLSYMQQRYYDPEIGRFLSIDPVTVNSSVGANFNRYWYANNNPYRFTDPDGRSPGDPDQPDTTPKAERRPSGESHAGTAGGTQSQFRVAGALAGSRYNTRDGGSRGDSSGGRRLTPGEASAARSELPGIKTDPIRVMYDSPTESAMTPWNTIHFPSSAADCTDFSTCHQGTYTGWFIHEATHAWQHQNGRSPILGRLFSSDFFSTGNYLPLKRYLLTPSPTGLSTEKEADWHMWHYECGHSLSGGC